MSGVGVNVYAGATEMAYDATTDLFYITDASNNIYSMTDTGETHFVDILGSGIDINGLAVNSTPSYSVRYTDGVDGEVIFADQQYFAQEGLNSHACRLFVCGVDTRGCGICYRKRCIYSNVDD